MRHLLFFGVCISTVAHLGCATQKTMTKVEKSPLYFNALTGITSEERCHPKVTSNGVETKKASIKARGSCGTTMANLPPVVSSEMDFFKADCNFDTSGQLMQELKLMDGKLHGPFKVHWPHGPLSLEGEHYANVKKGPFIYYNTAGVERKRVASPLLDPTQNNEVETEGDINLRQVKASIQAANLAIEQCYETFLTTRSKYTRYRATRFLDQ